VAGLAVASDVEPDLGPLAVSYVLLLAVIGPIAARLAEPMADRFLGPSDARTQEATEEIA
jgi:CPA2 family monovalent cation:H+ antiporter-2